MTISKNLINSNVHINSLFELSTPKKDLSIVYQCTISNFLRKDVFWVCQPTMMVLTGMLSYRDHFKS